MKRAMAWLWVFVIPSIGLADGSHWSAVAEAVVQHIDAAETAYQAGEIKQAKQSLIKAYFGVFEDRKMEAAMRMELGAKHAYQVESQFGELRKAIQKDAGTAVVSGLAAAIREAMRRDARLLDQAGVPSGVFRVEE